MSMHAIRRCPILIVALLIVLGGCASIGPPSVSRDRFDYVVAISESYKRQTLLNLVKTRYVDAPVFMEIDSVINQYSIEGELGFELAPSARENNLLLGRGTYTDRPTITYSPVTGERYTRSLLRPLPISGVFLLLQSGYPADAILRVCVQSINGLDNRRSGALSVRAADPGFEEAVALMRDLQGIRGLYFQVEAADEKVDVKAVFRPATTPAVAEKARRLRTLLGLDPDGEVFRVVYAAQPGSRTEIAVMSRAMMQIMVEYAADIEVPQSDIQQGRVTSTAPIAESKGAISSPLIQVRTGTDRPDQAHVAVSYRGHWFWVDDNDIYSKTTLQFLMTLFSLTERGTPGAGAPVITVPTH